jgi:hypothetical protein
LYWNASSSPAAWNVGSTNITLGRNAGQTGTGQGLNAIAIGQEAGQTGQGAGAIAIGYRAGNTGQRTNSIVINASGSAVNTGTTGTCFVAPIRNPNTSYDNFLNYDAITKEVVYNYFIMPVGTTAQRPGTTGPAAVTGMMRYNTTTGFPEFYNGTSWFSYQIYPNLILINPSGSSTTYSITGGSFSITPSFTNTSPYYYTILVTGPVALTFTMNGAGGGGSQVGGSSGGNGGATVGTFYLLPTNTYYLVIGQGGASRGAGAGPSTGPPTSGIGGGGLAGTQGFGGEGGGLTGLFLNSITLGYETSTGLNSDATQIPGINTTINTGSGSGPILIAGGGGGGAYDDTIHPGAVGGGGLSGQSNGGTAAGFSTWNGGGGGTLTSGGAGGSTAGTPGSQSGAQLVGGSPCSSGDGGGGGAGGGGYWGGGAGSGQNNGTGGGGGSGFYSGVPGSSTTALVSFVGSVTGNAGAGSAGGTGANPGTNGSVTITFFSF